MTPQQHAFAATVPNMIPRPAATPSTSNRVPCFPSLDIKHHGSYPDMPSIVSRPPGNAYMWLGLHFNSSPHRPELPSSPAMYSSTFGLSSDLTKVNLVSYSSDSQAVRIPVLPRQMQGAPSAVNMVQAVQSTPKPAGKTISRLPSNDVPRKAPLQGKSYAGISLPKNTSRKFPKPRQQRSTSRAETPTKATTPVQKLRQDPDDGRPGALVQSPSVLSETSRAKKRPRDSHDEESHEVEIVEVRKKAGEETDNKNNIAETTSSGKARNDEEKTRASTPRCRPAKKRATRATSPTQSSHHHRRSIYDYEVPLEVEGIRKALGPDNWDEYIYLLESLWLQKATAHEFEQSTKSLFRIEYDTIRKKMNSMVVKKMITPRLKEIRSSLPQRSEECRGS
ncbi:hypothetical protein yc1106_03489 [Curvularia clavata]|uniref:Uncharacterized protein n=1 Tax=Curvularia clavata TaxID=95742 RepID=A0A9Q8Z5U0_CURCL|nr:hypothetical protein yc1106_03489 [Curvularia clavata]